VRRTATNSRGYADDELTKQLMDSKQIFDVGGAPRFQNLPEDHPDNHVQDGYNQWPSPELLPEFKSTVSTYFEACTNLCSILLGAVVESLGPGERVGCQLDVLDVHTLTPQ
jgi:isopenicillin N synthase-like dioxygenase